MSAIGWSGSTRERGPPEEPALPTLRRRIGQLRLSPNEATVGSLSDSRPQMFRPEATIEQPGLEIRRKPDSICVRWEHREWWFEPG